MRNSKRIPAIRVIELEDQGQDFTRLLIDGDNVIIDAQPFQGWLWKGYKILQKTIRPRMKLKLQKPNQKEIVLKYPVVLVREPQ